MPAQSLQPCPTLCDPMDCSLPGPSVYKCPIIGGYAIPRKQCLILEDSGKMTPKGSMGRDLRKNQGLPGERRQRPAPGEMGTDQDVLRQEGP